MLAVPTGTASATERGVGYTPVVLNFGAHECLCYPEVSKYLKIKPCPVWP
jgi:hypothetical protein